MGFGNVYLHIIVSGTAVNSRLKFGRVILAFLWMVDKEGFLKRALQEQSLLVPGVDLRMTINSMPSQA